MIIRCFSDVPSKTAGLKGLLREELAKLARPCGERLHRKQMLRRGSEYPKSRMIEHPGGCRIPAGRDV
jgi:hypothetical protein